MAPAKKFAEGIGMPIFPSQTALNFRHFRHQRERGEGREREKDKRNRGKKDEKRRKRKKWSKYRGAHAGLRILPPRSWYILSGITRGKVVRGESRRARCLYTHLLFCIAPWRLRQLCERERRKWRRIFLPLSLSLFLSHSRDGKSFIYKIDEAGYDLPKSNKVRRRRFSLFWKLRSCPPAHATIELGSCVNRTEEPIRMGARICTRENFAFGAPGGNMHYAGLELILRHESLPKLF